MVTVPSYNTNHTGDAAPSRPPSTPGEPQPPIDANGVGNGVPDAQPSQEAAPISSTEAPTLPQQPSVVPVGSNEAADKEAAPPEKKKKKKTLSWNKDADLVQTRWFLKVCLYLHLICVMLCAWYYSVCWLQHNTAGNNDDDEQIMMIESVPMISPPFFSLHRRIHPTMRSKTLCMSHTQWFTGKHNLE